MADSYPARERYFSHRFCRILTKAAVANEIGSETCWMLTVIAHQEDAKRYRGPVTYYNGQLMPLCGFNRDRQLIQARNRAIEAGWLHYEPGSKSKPGVYWCLIPAEYADLPDTPMDEGTPGKNRKKAKVVSLTKIGSESGNESGNQNSETREFPLPKMAVNAQSMWQSMRSQCGNLPTLDPNPDPCSLKDKTSASAEVSAETGETPAPPRPPDEPTEFTFECVGKGAKTWTLSKSKLDEYLEAYPDLDVRAEIRKSRQWIRDNPTNRKTATGMPAFLTRWLNKAQNFGGRNHAGNQRGRSGPQIGPGQRYDPDAKGGSF